MPCKPCEEKAERANRAAEQRVTKPGYVVNDKTLRDRGACPHGVRPWFNCETCAGESAYTFKGNFR